MLDLDLRIEQSQITAAAAAATEPATHIQQDITLSAKQSVCHNPTELILQPLTLSNETSTLPRRWYSQPTQTIVRYALGGKQFASSMFAHVLLNVYSTIGPHKPVIPPL